MESPTDRSTLKVSSEESDGASVPPDAAFVAAVGGDVYHWVGSSRWRSIAPLARVWFATEEAARTAGYSPSEASWDRLEEFEILGEIGRGGSAIVYRARDRALGRDVAIKVIASNFGADPETIARFGQEARLLAGLRHPNIVAAYSVKQLQGGGLALVMEYVSGRTLREVLNSGEQLPIDRVERILREVAAALVAAHDHGIVHRDVKPDNIFLDDETGRALLADFGVALKLDNPTGLTIAGTAVGTPNYMSPEQIDGLSVDGRSDLYSLGLIGWELLVGEKPWEGESLYSVIYKQKNEELPSLRALRPDVPVRLMFAIEGALAKHPRARWESVKDFVQQLEDESLTARWEQWSMAMLWKRRAMARFSRPKARSERATDAVAKTVVFRHPDTPRGEPQSSAPGDPPKVVGAVPVSATARLRALRSRRAKNWKRAIMAVGTLGVGLAAFLIWTMGTADVAPDAVEGASGGVATGVAGSAGAGSVTQSSPYPYDSPAPDFTTRSVVDSSALAIGGDTVPADSAVLPEAIPEVPLLTVARTTAAIAGGGMHSCAVQGGSAVLCWGGNDRGQLGTGDAQQGGQPVRVEQATNVQAVVAGSFHTCALARDGAVVCWGDSGDGRLGGTPSQGGVVRVTQPRFVSISLGSAHTCGVGRDERAYCWGSNAMGQLGDGSRTSRAAPTRVRIDQPVASVAAGWNHSCALNRQGQVFCWGRNDRGQLGVGTTTARATPGQVVLDARFTSLTAGSAHTCGLTTDGETFCWGQNTDGRLGDGTTTDRSAPSRVRTTHAFVQISAGGSHTCALTSSGTAFCWGQNNYGQLGTGSTAAQSVPARVQTDATFQSISSSGAHTCGRTADGSNYCWGYNIEGQIGDGTRTHRTTPQRVEGLANSPPA